MAIHSKRRPPLANFTAKVTGEILRDDGVEGLTPDRDRATLNGRAHRLTIPASEFAGLSWTTRELGAKAMVYPGQMTRDHARVAIQLLSPDFAERRLFVHTGWRQLDGHNVYLHGAGALGPQGPVRASKPS